MKSRNLAYAQETVGSKHHLIYHCEFLIANLSLHIKDDIYGIYSSKSAIYNPKSEWQRL